MLPKKGRRKIIVDNVEWHYVIRGGVIAQNPGTGEIIECNADGHYSITPSLVAEIIKLKGKLPVIKQEKKYITTTLPYANSTPHMGHAFEFILGDALRRYFTKIYGQDNVHFNIGLDEHGDKIFDAAKEQGLAPKEYLAQYDKKWKEFCVKFDIQCNSFYRTSHPRHYELVSKFWEQCKRDGLIYKAPYHGLFCKGCQAKKTEKDLVNGKCSDHPSLELQEIHEEVYFLTLKKYQKQLQNWLESNPILKPENKIAELRNLIADIDKHEDLAISRYKSNVQWGIPVPGDYEQVVYVWFEALLNYIFVIGYYDNREECERYWKNSVQIFGPDNLRFQALVFQAMLFAAGLNNTQVLLCHGTILDGQGHKMSKTEGNVVDPIDQLEKYGIDAVRFYALAGLQTYGNSGWSEERLVEFYNTRLADNFGNLLSRVVQLSAKLEEKDEDFRLGWTNPAEEWEGFSQQLAEADKLWGNYEVTAALDKVNDVLRQANQYITEKAPWKDTCVNPAEVLVALYNVLEEAARLYSPVIPKKSHEALRSLWSSDKIVLFPKISVKETTV